MYDVQIESVLLVSRQGKTRLAKWYLNASLKEKTRMIRDITSLVLSRPHKQCNFIEFKEKKIIYKRWANCTAGRHVCFLSWRRKSADWPCSS